MTVKERMGQTMQTVKEEEKVDSDRSHSSISSDGMEEDHPVK